MAGGHLQKNYNLLYKDFLIGTGENNLTAKIIILGIIIGMISSLSYGLFLVLTAIILAGLVLWRISEEEDRHFIVTLFIAGLSLRIIIFSIFYIFSVSSGGAGEMIPDSRLYLLKAVSIIRSYLYPGKEFPPLVEEGVGGSGYLFILIPFYLISGYDFSSPAGKYYFYPDKLINCLIGTLSGIVIFYLTKEVFGKRTAKISSFFVVFYPTLVLWSMSNLREPTQIFLTSLALFYIVRLQKRQKITYLLLIITMALVLKTIRNYTFYLILLAAVMSYFINLKLSLIRKLFIIIATLGIITIFLNCTNRGRILKNEFFTEQSIADRILLANAGILSQPGSNYMIYEDGLITDGKIDKLKLTRGFLKGWLFFMLSPFPWAITTKPQLLTYPEMIIWYFMIPFVILGMLLSWRYRFKLTFALIFYVIVFTSAHALVEGNIGSTLRHRDLILPIYFLFVAAGLVKFLYGGKEFEEIK